MHYSHDFLWPFLWIVGSRIASKEYSGIAVPFSLSQFSCYPLLETVLQL